MGYGGAQHATAAQFVAAWRGPDDAFAALGADNVSRVWPPNVINPLQNVSPTPYRPDAAYVAGIVGCWTGYQSQGAYTTLCGPTEQQIEALTGNPHMPGFVYFDYGTTQGKQAHSPLEDRPAALAAWRTAIHVPPIAPVGSAG